MPEDDYTESREFPACYVRVRGRISRVGQVTWSPCLRTDKGPKEQPPPQPPAKAGEQTPAEGVAAERPVNENPYTVALQDYRDQPLASVTVTPQFLARDQEWAPFVVRLPYHQHVQAVTLRRGEHELGRLTVPTDRPYFTLLHPNEDDFIDPTGVLHLHWAGHDSEHAMTFFVRYTHNGRDWLRPGVNLHANDFYLDLNEMPGAKRCVVQVIATNGYRTSYVQTRHFEVPPKPPEVLLTNSDGPVLSAQGFSRQHGPIAGEAIRWLTQDNREVGRGANLDLRTLAHGIHHIRIVVTDEAGQESVSYIGEYDASTGTRIMTTQPL